MDSEIFQVKSLSIYKSVYPSIFLYKSIYLLIYIFSGVNEIDWYELRNIFLAESYSTNKR